VSRQLLEYHPVVGYRFIPHLKARVPHESGGYLVRTNGAGFRCNREPVAARTPGLRRVLLFGDSFSAGDGVSNEKRWGDLLETLVPALEVYNFALPGTGTDQQYLAWREHAGAIEHDVLLLAVLVENIRRVVAHYRTYLDDQGREVCYEKPYFERKDGALALHNVPPRREPIPSAELAAEQACHGRSVCARSPRASPATSRSPTTTGRTRRPGCCCGRSWSGGSASSRGRCS
jgi:hypothetical protein